MVDALNHTNQYTYDGLNRMTNTTFQDQSTQATGYDLVGRKAWQTDQASNTTWFGYDGLGRLTAVTNAPGKAEQPDQPGGCLGSADQFCL